MWRKSSAECIYQLGRPNSVLQDWTLILEKVPILQGKNMEKVPISVANMKINPFFPLEMNHL